MADQPTYTRVPNDLLDAMDTLGNAELRVLLAIARKTHGWQKECDVISTRQIETMTGLGHRHVLAAIDSVLARGLISRTPAKRRGFCYRLVPLGDQFPKVTSSPRVPDLVPLGDQSSPDLVPLGDQQKKDLKEKKEKRVRAPKQATLDQFNEACQIAKDTIGKKLTPGQASSIAETVQDIPRWTQVVSAWDRRYGTMNVEGLLDWYQHPEKMERRNGSSKHDIRPDARRHSERGAIREADPERGF